MRSRRLLALVMLLLMAVVVTAGVQVRHSYIVETSFEITDVGDTAQVMLIYDFLGLDSFDYDFDIEGGVITAVDSQIKWTSSVFKMVLTPDADTVYDSSYFFDTLIFPSTDRLGVDWTSPLQVMRIDVTSPIDSEATYACSLVIGANKYGFDYNPPGTDTTLATFIDSLVDSINAVGGISDSVVAHDSTANAAIKIISKFAQVNFTGDARWTIELTGAEIAKGDSVITTVGMWCDSIAAFIEAETNLTDSVTGHDSATYVLITSLQGSDQYGGRWTLKSSTGDQDTASHASANTVAMTCDSLAAAANAIESLAVHFTAANSGDTGWTITADHKGWTVFELDIAAGDSAQDTTTTTNGKNDWSSHTDTFPVVQLNIGPDNATGMIFRAIIKASEDTLIGIGGSDSGYLTLYTIFDGLYFALAGETVATVPCTLWYPLTTSTAGTDTLLKEKLSLVVRIADTATDSSGYWPSWETEIDYNIW